MECSDCRAPLPPNKRRKGTMCRRCTARAKATSPEHRAAASAAMIRRWADPVEAARMVSASRRGLARPECREQRRRQGHANFEQSGLKMIEAARAPEVRAKAAATNRRRRMSWLPDEYAAFYHDLRVNRSFSAAEARRIVEDQIFHDRRRARSETSPISQMPLEAQVAAVRAGARLVRTFVAPRIDPAFTLGGVSEMGA